MAGAAGSARCIPLLYGGLVGRRRRGRRRGVGTVRGATSAFGKVVETCAYYLNPFEWWAYSRDDHWPPTGIVDGLGWKQPAVQPFAARDRSPASPSS